MTSLGTGEEWKEALTTGVHTLNRQREPRAVAATDPRDASELDGLPPQPRVLVPAGRGATGAGRPAASSPKLPDHDCKDTYYREVKEIWADAGAGSPPRHTVALDAFHIDVTPVTNGQYRRFMAAIEESGSDAFKHPDEPPDKARRPHYWPDAKWNKDRYPVVGVDWYDAYAYCSWAEGRLPTEAEWERAARGDDGRTWPWGSVWIPDGANLMAEEELRGRGIDGRPWPWPAHSFGGEASPLSSFGDGYENLAPVGVFPAGASPYGVMDTAGQVFEWVADGDGEFKVLRGGAFLFDERFATTTSRHADRPGRKEAAYYGFRCAADTVEP